MKPKLLILVISILTSSLTYACCAENGYRIFPLGEVKSTLYFIEFSYSRNCDMKGDSDEHDFTFYGTSHISIYENGQLQFIEALDTFNFIDCHCSYSNHFEKTTFQHYFAPSYQKALKLFKQKKKSQFAIPISIEFNDTTNVNLLESSTESDFIYELEYKNLVTIPLHELEIISCFPDKLAEVRTYETTNYILTLLRLRCYFHSDEQINLYKKLFLSLENAFWAESAQWHGQSMDYLIVLKKK